MDHVCFQSSFCGVVAPQLKSKLAQTRLQTARARFSATARRRRVRTPLQSSAKNANPSPGRDEGHSDALSLSESQSHVPTTTTSNWMFFDVARVLVKGGTGGDGCMAFLRVKGNAKGGPSGGNGGARRQCGVCGRARFEHAG
eukprot:IDg10810t1